MLMRRDVVVIAGASAAVGTACAQAFARNGAHIALLTPRVTPHLDALCDEICRAGGKALVVQVDLTDGKRVEAAAEKVEQELGCIDVWINSAMTSILSPVRRITALEFSRVIDVTYLACVHGTLAALHRMLPHDRGIIIQAGSGTMSRTLPIRNAYGAAKRAIENFTASLGRELLDGGSQIHVSIADGDESGMRFEWLKVPAMRVEQTTAAILRAVGQTRRDLQGGLETAKAVWAHHLGGRSHDPPLIQEPRAAAAAPPRPTWQHRRQLAVAALLAAAAGALLPRKREVKGILRR